MQALLTARRTKAGQEDAFRKQWRRGEQPEGMVDAFLLEDEDDPRETLSLSVWESPDALLAYRTSDAATQRQRKLQGLLETQRWQRAFAALRPADIKTGGSKLPLLLLLLLAAGGVGVFLVLKRRQQGQAEEQGEAEEPARQQPPPASGDTLPTGATGPMPASYADHVNAGVAPSGGAVPSPEGYPRQG